MTWQDYCLIATLPLAALGYLEAFTKWGPSVLKYRRPLGFVLLGLAAVAYGVDVADRFGAFGLTKGELQYRLDHLPPPKTITKIEVQKIYVPTPDPAQARKIQGLEDALYQIEHPPHSRHPRLHNAATIPLNLAPYEPVIVVTQEPPPPPRGGTGIDLEGGSATVTNTTCIGLQTCIKAKNLSPDTSITGTNAK